MEYQIFEEQKNLVRDSENKAVLFTDNAALIAHLKQREQLEKVDKIEERLNTMESKIDSLLCHLTKILNKE